MQYPVETFTPEERARLAPHVTNLDRPVFALVNLPETVKGALFARIFLGYGDDSVAQLGGAHVACEWVSNVLTKVPQRPRLAAYLEQSTRYIAYDAPMPGGGYRFYRDAELGSEYEAAMDALFGAYATCLPRVA